jgi:hypothetical protein
MKFVSSALTALGIEFRACTGSVKLRNQSIQEFKSGNVPILILSSEDSVAGLNLTEASHVVIFHPFLVDGQGNIAEDGEFTANTKMALSFEKQGIARAIKGGKPSKCSWCGS